MRNTDDEFEMNFASKDTVGSRRDPLESETVYKKIDALLYISGFQNHAKLILATRDLGCWNLGHDGLWLTTAMLGRRCNKLFFSCLRVAPWRGNLKKRLV